MTTDLHRMPLPELAEHFAQEQYAAGRTKREASLVRRGVHDILSRLEGQPGETWQEKWVAADIEPALRDEFLVDYHTKRKRNHLRATQHMALSVLVGAGVIRPSLLLVLDRKFGVYMLKGVIAAHHDDIEQVVQAAAKYRQISHTVARDIRYALAGMITLTGKPLKDITPDEWAVAYKYRRELISAHTEWDKARTEAITDGKPIPDKPKYAFARHQVIPVERAYTAALAAGLMTPNPSPPPGISALPATLPRAASEPETLRHLFDTIGRNLPPRVAALLYDALTIEAAGLDRSTIRSYVTELAVFFKIVIKIIPGHDSLQIPAEYLDEVMRQLKVERTSIGTFLIRIRSAYLMADLVIRRHGLTQHEPAAGHFPWPVQVVRKIAKQERMRRRSKLSQHVRAHLNHLDGLVTAAKALLRDADALADAANAAQPGDTFEVNGVTYERSIGTLPAQGTGRPYITVRIVGQMAYFDVNEYVHRAAKAAALMQLLRETGLRIEEAAELTVENIAPFLAGSTEIPVLHVNPSKQDRARIVGLIPEALEALGDLIFRTRALYGHDPLVPRIDRHENVDQAAAHLIFFVIHSGAFLGPSHEAFGDWIDAVVDYYNAHINPGPPIEHLTPHQLRRLFATDLAERGADVLTIKELLGHRQLSTTGIYIHTSEERTINEHIKARRRAKAQTAGTPCTRCHGHGYTTHPIDEDTRNTEEPTS